MQSAHRRILVPSRHGRKLLDAEQDSNPGLALVNALVYVGEEGGGRQRLLGQRRWALWLRARARGSCGSCPGLLASTVGGAWGGTACRQQGCVAAVTTGMLLPRRTNGSREGAVVGAGDPSGRGRCVPDSHSLPDPRCAPPPPPASPCPSPAHTRPSQLAALAGGSPSCRIRPSRIRAVLVGTGPRTATVLRHEGPSQTCADTSAV